MGRGAADLGGGRRRLRRDGDGCPARRQRGMERARPVGPCPVGRRAGGLVALSGAGDNLVHRAGIPGAEAERPVRIPSLRPGSPSRRSQGEPLAYGVAWCVRVWPAAAVTGPRRGRHCLPGKGILLSRRGSTHTGLPGRAVAQHGAGRSIGARHGESWAPGGVLFEHPLITLEGNERLGLENHQGVAIYPPN